MKHYEMCTGNSCTGLERRGALLPQSTDIKELCTLMRGTPFCTDFKINGLRRICESLPAFTSWSTGYESVYYEIREFKQIATATSTTATGSKKAPK